MSRQKVDIGAISITEIADQYLAEVSRMETLDLDVASDFLLVASTPVSYTHLLRSPVEKPLGHRVAFRGTRLRHRCCLRGDVARAFAGGAARGRLRAWRRYGIH